MRNVKDKNQCGKELGDFCDSDSCSTTTTTETKNTHVNIENDIETITETTVTDTCTNTTTTKTKTTIKYKPEDKHYQKSCSKGTHKHRGDWFGWKNTFGPEISLNGIGCILDEMDGYLANRCCCKNQCGR